MRYTQRKEFLYDPEVFHRSPDVNTALSIYHEFVVKHAPHPTPRFFEVNRDTADIDPLYHVPLAPRTQFSRELDLPCLNMFQRPDWRLTRLGLVPQRRDQFHLANLTLKEADYFPTRGDLIYWTGYRYLIINVVVPPDAYWQQTGVWLGLACECAIAPEGDASPLRDLSQAAPAELASTRPLPERPPPER